MNCRVTLAKATDERPWVRVSAPATCANIGSGFDALGLAIDVWNEVKVRVSTSDSMVIRGQGATALPRDSGNLVMSSLDLAFSLAGVTKPSLDCVCTNDIPLAKGLGSSSAAIVSGFMAGAILCELLLQRASHTDKPRIGADLVEDNPLRNNSHFDYGSDDANFHSCDEVKLPLFFEACVLRGNWDLVSRDSCELAFSPKLSEFAIQVACCIEGHPDNAIPAILGGMQLGIRTVKNKIGGHAPKSAHNQSTYSIWEAVKITVPVRSLFVVLFLPTASLKTEEARAALPKTVPLGDAVFNCSRCAGLVVQLANASSFEGVSADATDSLLSSLHVFMEDRLHQPYRAKLVPYIDVIIDEAIRAGAYGACLSGAGPAILAFTKPCAETAQLVANAMLAGAHSAGVHGEVLRTVPIPYGARISPAGTNCAAVESVHNDVRKMLAEIH